MLSKQAHLIRLFYQPRSGMVLKWVIFLMLSGHFGSNKCEWVETDSILSSLQVKRDDYFGQEIVWIWESNWGLNAHPSGQDAVLHQFLRGEELPGSALQTKTGIFKVSMSYYFYFITIMFFYQPCWSGVTLVTLLLLLGHFTLTSQTSPTSQTTPTN